MQECRFRNLISATNNYLLYFSLANDFKKKNNTWALHYVIHSYYLIISVHFLHKQAAIEIFQLVNIKLGLTLQEENSLMLGKTVQRPLLGIFV